jgi:hypothetical protein
MVEQAAAEVAAAAAGGAAAAAAASSAHERRFLQQLKRLYTLAKQADEAVFRPQVGEPGRLDLLRASSCCWCLRSSWHLRRRLDTAGLLRCVHCRRLPP